MSDEFPQDSDAKPGDYVVNTGMADWPWPGSERERRARGLIDAFPAESMTHKAARDSLAGLERERLLEAELAEFREQRARPFSDEGQDHLRMRMSGLAKGIDEEMLPGTREFCLGALDDFVDAYGALKDENLALAAERDSYRDALAAAEAPQ